MPGCISSHLSFHSCAPTSSNSHRRKRKEKKKKKKKKKKEKPVTLLKLHASPVAGIYSIEKVSPLQIESQLHSSSGQNKIESPPSKHVPGCLGISQKSPAHQSTGEKNDESRW